jgi:hypothetical protein
MDTALRQAIEDFKQAHKKDWSTKRDASGECGYASNQFVFFLEKRQIKSKVEELSFHDDMHLSPAYMKAVGGHYVVNIDEKWLVDWTARQYDPTAPYPLMIDLKPEKKIQWLTTKPSGRAHTCGADDGVTGWKMHAVVASDKTLLKDLGRQPALCGLRPRHGWGMDLFIEDHCKRCEKKANELPQVEN